MSGFLAGPLWALVSGFAALGAVGSVLMTRQPEFYLRWQLDNAEWGWVLFAGGLGGVLAFPLNRWLLRHWGSRLMLYRFGTVGGVVMAAIPWLPGLGGLLLGLFVMGMIYNGVGVSINHQASQWESRRGTRMMGRLHATFFVGSVLSALLSSVLAALEVSLPLHMAAVGLVAALVHRRAATRLQVEGVDAALLQPGGAAPARSHWLGVGLLFGGCTVLESGVMGWVSVFLSEGLKANASVSGVGLALFSGAMACGRLVSDGLVNRYGAVRLVRVGAALCVVALVLAASVKALPVALFAFALTGFGLAAAAPVIFSVTGRMGGDALALVSGLGALGGLLGPVMLGRVAGMASLEWVLYVLAAVAALVAWQARVLDGGCGAPAMSPAPRA